MKNAVLVFEGVLYLPLWKDEKNGIVTGLSDLNNSSPLVTISTPTFTLSENLAQTSTTSTLVFDGTTYPLTTVLFGGSNPSTPLTGSSLTTLSSLMTFPPKTFILPWPSSSLTLNIEAPCSYTTSSFDYTLTPSLPSWLTYTPTSSTSTQTFTIQPSSLTGNLVTFRGELKNTQPFDS